ASDGGADSLALGVLAENEKGRGFFEHLGYTKEETKQASYGGKEQEVSIFTLAIK
ncbi:TPA: GNAT family N-acetyltransferase, partial [Listeria monocytogenes]|nr:GNAT family N-acetyltransferase [Listeria monocytogenes]